MNTKQGKIWGETTEFFRNAIVSAHHLSIIKGGQCSRHLHNQKFNQFYVLSGRLEVTIWTAEGIKDITTLIRGESTAVHPGLEHRFKALENTECIEVYQVLLLDPDIVRKDTGSLKK